MPPDMVAAFQLAVAHFAGPTLALSSASPAARRVLGLDATQGTALTVSAADVLLGGLDEGLGTDRALEARSRLEDLARRSSGLPWGEGVVLEFTVNEGGTSERSRAEVLVTASTSSPSGDLAEPTSSSYTILFLRPAPPPPLSHALPQSPPLVASTLSPPVAARSDELDAAGAASSSLDSRSDGSSLMRDLDAPHASRSSSKRPSVRSPSVASFRTESSSDCSTRQKRRVVTGQDRLKLPFTPDVTNALVLATSRITDGAPRGALSPPPHNSQPPSPASSEHSGPTRRPSTATPSMSALELNSSSSASSASLAPAAPLYGDSWARRPSIDASFTRLAREVDANAGSSPHYRLPINQFDGSASAISPALLERLDPLAGIAASDFATAPEDIVAIEDNVATEESGPSSPMRAQAVEDALKMRERDARPPLTISQLTNLIETMPEIAFITDTAGQVVWLSKAWFDYTGQDPAFNPSIEEWMSMFHPDDLEHAFGVYLGGIKAGNPFSFEYRVKGRDGILRWHMCQGRAHRGEDGEITNWFCNISNVDDLVKTRHDALLVKERTKAVLEGSDLTLLTVDVNLVVTFFEGKYPPFTFKTSPPKLVGEQFHDLCADEELREGIRKVLDDEEEMVHVQTETKDGEGGKRYTRYRLVALRGDPSIPSSHPDANAITGCIAVGVDVSERVHAEEALESTRVEAAELAASEVAAREASRLKTEFLTTISHEIRTPIAGILGICELLLADSARLADDQRALVEKAVRSGEILLDLVGAVLDVRKVETGELKLEAAPFTLADVLADARLFSVIAQKKSLDWVEEERGAHYGGTLLGDRLRLRQILANALNNAIKFTREGNVTLSLEQVFEDDAHIVVRFVVADTGVGIDEHVLPTLFRPFKQASAGTAREYGGSGLGLTIAKNLVEMMDGSIELASKLGHGSRMTITIPFNKAPLDVDGTERDVSLEKAAAAALKVHQQEQKVEEIRSRRRPEDVRILLAEDNELISEIVTRTLRKARFVVDAVDNGQKAVEQVHNQEYSVVLMDGQMPGVDGYEATKIIRSSPNPRIHNLRIIALTASAIAGDRERCLAAGMSTYLAKPVRAKELEATIWQQVELADRLQPVGA